MMNIRANYQIFAIRINPAMKILAILFLLFTEIPLELYSPKYTSETMDSVYNACLVEAESCYEQDMEQACCYLMADWAYGESMLDLSEYLIERALESRIEDMVLRADCLSMAGALARLRGNLAAAIEYSEECLDIDRMSGNQENISSSLHNIACLYLTYGDKENAVKYIDEAIAIEEKLDRKAYLAIRYGVGSEIYLSVGEMGKSLEYANEALRLDSLDNRVEKVAVRRSQKGAVLMAMGKMDDAEKELDLALPVFRKFNSLNSLAITCTQLGEIAALNNKVEQARAFFTEAVAICQGMNHIYMESRAREGLFKLLRNSRPEEAIEHLERYAKIQSELHNEKATELMQSFDAKYDALKREQTILIQEKKLKWRNILTATMILMLVFLCLSIYQRGVAIKSIRQKNALLIKANLDKDRLLALAKTNIPNDVSKEIISITSEMEEMPDIKLTKREHEIAELCAKGKLNKEIAAELGISQRTVETHKNNLFRKLGINNTIELMRYMQWYMNK